MVQLPKDMPKAQNLPFNPGNMPKAQNLLANVNDTPKAQNLLAPTNVNDMDVSESAAGLYVDPSPIFQPSLDFIGEQRNQANDRYAQNKADIANIFGNLTQVNKESQARVSQQFQESIAQQQMNTAERLAQARTGAEQTQQSAIAAMDERGGGPMGNLQASPALVASERGIADSANFAQIWEGQQGAIQEQTQQDLQSGLRSLGQQEVQSNMQLKTSLENTLNQLSGQEVGVRSSLAEAIYGGKSSVAQANYNEVLAEKAAAEARRLASIRGMYSVQQAEIDAQNKLDMAQLAAQNRVTNYENDSLGISRRINDLGGDPNIFWPTVDSVGAQFPDATSAYQTWLEENAGVGELYKGAARDWFSRVRYTDPGDSLIGGVNFGSQYGLE